ncbi:MAG: 4Fe-4S binding protein [Planctomycetes bacterium]|nr:4Fe-4S binding protein [Planctomycetota bacterium]
MVSAREFIIEYWPAFVLIIATVVLGRFFCAWVCPMGMTIDITDSFLKKVRSQESGVRSQKSGLNTQNSRLKTQDSGLRTLKYYLLAFLILSLFISSQIIGWFDPLSIATNTYTFVIHPYLMLVINGFFGFLHNITAPVTDPIHSVLKNLFFALYQPFFKAHYLMLFVFLAIISFGVMYSRYWCRNICPLGALLALVSGQAIFKRVVSDKCTVCGKCESECRMGAITNEGKGTIEGECILCMTCQNICPDGAISFKRVQPVKQNVTVDLSKRGFFIACFSGIAAIPVLRLNSQSASGGLNKGSFPVIRPPGAVDEDGFLSKCVRCGECMRVCKTNGLHPTTLETGLEGAWTPRLIPRVGYCEYGCTLCGHVCPSGAIRPLELEVKQIVAIGKARINQSRCIPWVGYASLPELEKDWKDVNCAVCEEVCPVPTKAIHFNTYTDSQGREIRRPFVREDVCTGCGFCEYACPVRGVAAIVVEGIQPQVEVRIRYPSTTFALPQKIESWERVAEPVVYTGKDKLYEYIDGGAEPYLSFAFNQVAVAEYSLIGAGLKPAPTVKVDIWEFKNSDDAYGAFTLDRTGKQIAIGDEGAIYENFLWVWKNNYYIRIEPRTGTETSDDVKIIGEAILSKLSAVTVSKPNLLTYLPDEGLIPESIKFFHEKIILDNILITEHFIEKNIFGLNQKTQVVIADYKTKQEGELIRLMIAKYPGTEDAKKAFNDFVELRKGWGEISLNPTLEKWELLTFQDQASASGGFSTLCYHGNLVIATFLSKTKEDAEMYVKLVLARLES